MIINECRLIGSFNGHKRDPLMVKSYPFDHRGISNSDVQTTYLTPR